jgi:hypothetical protein
VAVTGSTRIRTALTVSTRELIGTKLGIVTAWNEQALFENKM